MRGRSVAVEARVPLDLIVDVMATYRLTRLATADVISEPIRRSIVGRVLAKRPDAPSLEAPTTAQEVVDELTDAPKVATLVTCRWCAGVWIAAGVVAARTLAPQLWDPVARGLTLSAGAVLLARLED
ncbi:MAG TPA: DUF1360 domain-containing protein [Aquihabitans sp.]|jgi:hypothetical protein|nr:DUF1360 domain-containing protein [Aquihabitans sp.]